VQPAVVSLTQATELGTAYRPDEIAAISELARERGLAVQMDGARFANAVAFLDCHPGDVTWRAVSMYCHLAPPRTAPSPPKPLCFSTASGSGISSSAANAPDT